MTQEEKELLAKDIVVKIIDNENSWYTIEIYYKGELIKRELQ